MAWTCQAPARTRASVATRDVLVAPTEQCPPFVCRGSGAQASDSAKFAEPITVWQYLVLDLTGVAPDY